MRNPLRLVKAASGAMILGFTSLHHADSSKGLPTTPIQTPTFLPKASSETFRTLPSTTILASYLDVATLLRNALTQGGELSMKEAFKKVSVEDKGLLDSYGLSQYSYHTGSSPIAVCFPSSTTEVSLLMRACAENRLNVIVRGGGTSLEGQVLPLGSPSAPLTGVYRRSTVVFDMSNMQKILEVNRQDLDCRVQAGVGWAGLGNALKPFGLAFPVDPGPGAVVGGMCGTGCSGTHAVRHGAMKANVLSLTAVASDGSVFKTGNRSRKSVSGLDLTSLLIGSEGSLAIVTEAVLKVVPLPEVTTVISTPFPSVMAACQAVSSAVAAGLPLGAAELLDSKMVQCVRDINPELLPGGAFPHILWKLSGSPGAVAEASARLKGLAQGGGCTGWWESATEEGAAALWEARKCALLSVQGAHGEAAVLTTDVCVPLSRLPQLLTDFEAHYEGEVQAKGAQALPPVYAVAHAGDGNAHHFIAFVPGTQQEVEAKALAEWLAWRAIALEGTCTGEHGVGQGKLKFLDKELGEGNGRVARAIKGVLDPSNLLNPGKKVAQRATE